MAVAAIGLRGAAGGWGQAGQAARLLLLVLVENRRVLAVLCSPLPNRRVLAALCSSPSCPGGGCRAEPYLGGERDRLPGAGAQFVDLRLGDVGPLLGIIQLVLHLAVLHQVGVGLLLLGAADGVRGVQSALPTPPPVPGLPGSPREGQRCPRRAEQGRALTASSNWRL